MMQYLAGRTDRMKTKAFESVETLADWEAVRVERRRELLADLSLQNVLPAEAPRPVVWGEIKGDGYTMHRIGFEILPNCWASANVYYPDPLPPKPSPGVLYVSGHATMGVQNYQYNAQMWARRGYVCLLLDTIEQSDNPGEHHGYNICREDLWISLGYTAAGGETLNSLRALDVLAADPAVDAGRLGVTGISGGGALSFYVAMIDDRIRAVASLCGISTPYDAVARRRMFRHCDCIYPLNLYGRDLSEYAALIAPRAALFCFGDYDALFHPEETRGLVDRARKVFDLYGVGDKCRLLADTCGHENSPVFYRATQEWFDLHVAGDSRPLVERNLAPELTERETVVFNGSPPQPNYLEFLPTLQCPRGKLTLPEDAEALSALRARVLADLPRPRALAVEQAPEFVLTGEWKPGGKFSALHQGRLENLETWIETFEADRPFKRMILSPADCGEYTQDARSRLGGVVRYGVTLAALEPRIAGGNLPPREAPRSPLGSTLGSMRGRLMQGMALTGQTPVTLTVHDIGAALDYLRSREEYRDVEIFLHGRGEGAVAVLHYAVAHEEVAGVILENLPWTHADGAPVPGILSVCDIPELVGLLAPRKVALVNQGHGNWTWPVRVYGRIGCNANLLFCEERTEAIVHLFGALPEKS